MVEEEEEEEGEGKDQTGSPPIHYSPTEEHSNQPSHSNHFTHPPNQTNQPPTPTPHSSSVPCATRPTGRRRRRRWKRSTRS